MTGQQSNFFKFKLVFLSPWDGRSFFFEVLLFLDENVWPEGKTSGFKGPRSDKLPVGQEWQRRSIGVVQISRAARTVMCNAVHQLRMGIFVGSISRSPYVFLIVDGMIKETYLPDLILQQS
jgi:hypothetical protein